MRLVATFLSVACALCAADAASVLNNARKAMGNPKTLKYSGTGVNSFFGQALTAGQPWPRRELESFAMQVNYAQKSLRMDLVFRNDVFGGRRQNSVVSGDRAWNAGANGANPQLAAAEERQLWIAMSPHGFVDAALAARNASVSGGAVSFRFMDKFTIKGVIDKSGLVKRVETIFPNQILGAMLYVFTYADYRDFGGVKFPGKIVQAEGGFPVNEFTVTAVEPDAAVDLPVPANVQAATIAPIRVVSSKLAEGVWLMAGGSHHSVVVEFAGYLAVIEAPQSEERSAAVIAEIQRMLPGKPIRYLVTTHHHFDHAQGLRNYVALGATIVTHASNVPYWKKYYRGVKTQAVTDKFTLSDAGQTLEVLSTTGDKHSDELLIGWLPKAKVLVEADAFSPGQPASTPPPADAVSLYENIQRRGLDVASIVGIHGSGSAPMAEFVKFVGR